LVLRDEKYLDGHYFYNTLINYAKKYYQMLAMPSVLPRCVLCFVLVETWAASDGYLSNLVISDLLVDAAGVMAALSAEAILVASAGDK
jgi:hypothetical protein